MSGTLGSILASGALARLVALFALHPNVAIHFRALQRITGLPHRSLQVELERLRQLGLLRRESVNRTVVYTAVPSHPRWAALRDLVREFATPADLLRVALARVPGIDAAFIYGSFARGTELHERSDVDVFVIGESLDQPEIRFALAEETLEVAGLLGREVNVTRFTPEKLASRYQPGRSAQFVRSVLSGDKEWLIGDESIFQLSSRANHRSPRAQETRRTTHGRHVRGSARKSA